MGANGGFAMNGTKYSTDCTCAQVSIFFSLIFILSCPREASAVCGPEKIAGVPWTSCLMAAMTTRRHSLSRLS